MTDAERGDSPESDQPESGLPEIKWNEQGLAAALCQDAGTGQVLMLAW